MEPRYQRRRYCELLATTLVGVVLIVPALVVSATEPLAIIPDARGFGMATPTGSGRHLDVPKTQVIKVTNLNTKVPGSLRAALEADARVVNSVREETGTIIGSQDDVDGWPELEENHRPLTLPENPNGDVDGDGYTNLEEWLHAFAAEVERVLPDLRT